MATLSEISHEDPEDKPGANFVDQLALVKELSGGRTYSKSEAFALEFGARQQVFARRQELLADSLTTPQVARLLGTTRQTPHDRVNKGALLAVMDQGHLRFPVWQFDPDGPNGVISGLVETLRALNISSLGKVSWMTLPNPYLGNRTPLQALKEGDVKQVVDEALCVGVV